MHHKRTLLSQVCLSPQLSLSPTHQLECCLNLTSSAPLDQLGWSAPLEKATREDEKKKETTVADWLAPRQATFGGEGLVALPLEPSRVGGCEEPGRHAESRRQGV